VSEMRHIKGLDPVNYVGRYCYPAFGIMVTSNWRRKILGYRERILPSGTVIPEVKVWQTLGYTWVPTSKIEFIWGVIEPS
jgi:hypothetical protein